MSSGKEALEAMIRAKRSHAPDSKSNTDSSSAPPPAKRFRSRGEIEAEKRRQEQERLELERRQQLQAANQATGASDGKMEVDAASLQDEQIMSGPNGTPMKVLPVHKVVKRLRKRNQPITLFGETDIERQHRLRLLVENEGEITEGMRNDFQILQRGDEKKGGASAPTKEEQKVAEEERKMELEAEFILDADQEPDSDEMRVSVYLQRLLRDWRDSLNARSDDEKNTAQGKSAVIQLKQTQLYISPLFTLLKKKMLSAEILNSLVTITGFLKAREYLRANYVYLQLAIGNAPWPMGVTMVGIHERSGREKINSSKVAHILNDETQRKYMHAFKRLMTFAQKAYPTNPSRMVG